MANSAKILDHALRLVEEGERDPVAAVRNQQQVAQALRFLQDHGSNEPQAPRVRADEPTFTELGCTHLVRVDNVQPVLPGATSNPYKIEWPGGTGIVKSLFAGTVDGLEPSLSMCSVRISINGSEEPITTGITEAFAPIRAFSPANFNWFRLKNFEVTAAQRWNVYFRNEYTGPNALALTPFLIFGYEQRSRR